MHRRDTSGANAYFFCTFAYFVHIWAYFNWHIMADDIYPYAHSSMQYKFVHTLHGFRQNCKTTKTSR